MLHRPRSPSGLGWTARHGACCVSPRIYGTNNLPDSSNMCHESTSVGLQEAIGLGVDIAAIAGICKALLERHDALASLPHAPVLDMDFIEQHTSGFEAFARYLLPCLGRTEIDEQLNVAQAVSIEDSTSCVHGSRGRTAPAAKSIPVKVLHQAGAL